MDPANGLLALNEFRLAREEGGPGRVWKVAAARAHGKRFVVQLAGVMDRDAAVELTGAMILLDRGALPSVRQGEHYRADLIGLRVRNSEGIEFGVVDHFVEAPGNAVMVVKGESEHWLPVSRQHLVEIDRVAGVIVVDWPADF